MEVFFLLLYSFGFGRYQDGFLKALTGWLLSAFFIPDLRRVSFDVDLIYDL